MGEANVGPTARGNWVTDGFEKRCRAGGLYLYPIQASSQHVLEQARPWVDAGKAKQLRAIWLAILREDSAGKSAAILYCRGPRPALHQHESRDASPRWLDPAE